MLDKSIYKIIYKKYDGDYFDNIKTSKALGYYQKNHFCEMFWNAAKESSVATSEKVIKQYISSRGYDLNLPFFRDFCQCSCEQNACEKNVLYEKLLTSDSVKNIEFVRRSDWEKVIYLVFTQKMFRLGEYIRKRYVDYLQRNGTFRDKFCILIEVGKYDEAKRLLEESSLYHIKKIMGMKLISKYVNAIPGWKCESEGYPYYDRRFLKILGDKQVAIIGPSDNGDHYEIDADNTVVIRFAYFENKDGKNKTNISYYNGLHSVRMEENGKVPDGISQCIFKYKRDTRFRKMLYKTGFGRMARWSLNIMIPGCSPNMLQITLADLLHYTDRITVYDSNLYINNLYRPGYASNDLLSEMSDYKKDSMFAQHDIIGNFLYTQSLYINGFFEADNKLSSILKMDSEEYAFQMELNNGFLEVPNENSSGNSGKI